MKYKRKSAIVDAFRFDQDVEITAPEWFMKEVENRKIFIDRCIQDGAVHVYGCTVYEKTGRMRAKIGDYIIQDPSGTIGICEQEKFREEYERT